MVSNPNRKIPKINQVATISTRTKQLILNAIFKTRKENIELKAQLRQCQEELKYEQNSKSQDTEKVKENCPSCERAEKTVCELEEAVTNLLLNTYEMTKEKKDLELQKEVLCTDNHFLNICLSTTIMKIELQQAEIDEQVAYAQTEIEAADQLEEERKVMENLRKNYLEMINKEMEEKVEENGKPFAWQSCEICLQKYSEVHEHTPRVLNCGHTLCLECARRVQTLGGVLCPFCREGSWLKLPQNLPKNYAVLDMCS
ncbi:hypothetical protein CAEBREN_19829 [Caenorhabditis brenneri]|uniref:RING-type domain-containing protein n=1 Tax=Caenorhabditis brenneri TaxID=135651 RepID=G0MUM0_CAEBE|nr:hypothetical protein CAEBREN_19829 [Caenorhabditis brenneri]